MKKVILVLILIFILKFTVGQEANKPIEKSYIITNTGEQKNM